MNKTLYEAIGVRPDATKEQIEAACLRLGEKYKNRINLTDAADRFAEIERAYETLTDPERRRAYDVALLAGLGDDLKSVSEARATDAAPLPNARTDAGKSKRSLVAISVPSNRGRKAAVLIALTVFISSAVAVGYWYYADVKEQQAARIREESKRAADKRQAEVEFAKLLAKRSELLEKAKAAAVEVISPLRSRAEVEIFLRNVEDIRAHLR